MYTESRNEGTRSIATYGLLYQFNKLPLFLVFISRLSSLTFLWCNVSDYQWLHDYELSIASLAAPMYIGMYVRDNLFTHLGASMLLYCF